MATDLNRAYLVDYARRTAPDGGQVLDYGCGDGQIVRDLRQAGFCCHGVDLFREGDRNLTNPYVVRSLFEGVLHRISDDNLLPFRDEFFDLIISEQVIEHVKDLDTTAAELSRVIRPQGVVYLQFPSLEVLREPHIGIPLSHRMPPGKLRTGYTAALRRAGFGRFKKEQATIPEWVASKLSFIDEYTHYRPIRQIEHTLETHGFSIRRREIEYCRYRSKEHSMAAHFLNLEISKPVAETMFRRLGFCCLELRKTGC